MGCNVLTIAPREVVMVKGNPETRRRMEAAGCKGHVIDADAISVPGGGGPPSGKTQRSVILTKVGVMFLGSPNEQVRPLKSGKPTSVICFLKDNSSSSAVFLSISESL